MTTLQEKINLIQSSQNMVEVEHILSQVTMDYLNLFSNTDRPFIRKNEEQKEWISAALAKYSNAIFEGKEKLIKYIPERLTNSAMYKKLI